MSAEHGAVAARVHAALLDGSVGAAPSDCALRELVRQTAPLLDDAGVRAVAAAVQARIAGIGPLRDLLDDPGVDEVMVNGPGPVWVERAGALERTAVHLDGPAIAVLVERTLTPLGLRADRSHPIVDARLPDGSRLHVVLPPVAVGGPYVTIRRFGAAPIPLEACAAPPVVPLLRSLVDEARNVVVSGATGAGKTTLLNALGAHLHPGERIVTVEDTAELRLPGDHVVRLETRPASPDGPGPVTVRDLVRAALRMRPDRIVVGEVRGPEALDMVQALSTGHDGSLSTCHANDPRDALRRIEAMALMGPEQVPAEILRDQLVRAVDVVVHVRRTGTGARHVHAVAEVLDDPADPARVRLLAHAHDVVALPCRDPRRVS